MPDTIPASLERGGREAGRGGTPGLEKSEANKIRLTFMFGRKKKRGLYYLLPGMNRANRIRQRQILKWSILAGIVFAALFGLLLYWLNTPRIRYHW